MIRTARTEEILRLQEIEVAAGEPFRQLGMLSIADDDPPSAEFFADAIGHGLCWVYQTEDAGVVAYLVALGMRASLHIEQVSVDPAFARQGYGARLIQHADGWAAAEGYPLLTLTTFTQVPWNAPYYARLGFREHLNAELGEVLRGEEGLGSGTWPRIGMAREIAAERVVSAGRSPRARR